MRPSFIIRHLSFVIPLLLLAARANAYVDLAPTLAKVINDSQKISTIEVLEVNPEKHTLLLKETRTLKGPDPSTQTIQHIIATSDSAAIPRHILQWAHPGAHAILFTSNETALVCIGQGWYQTAALTPGGGRNWKITIDRPDLPLTYYGPIPRLTEAITLMLANKDAILTTLPHGVTDAASFDLALNRAALPAAVKVQRIRANLKMPSQVMAVSNNPIYLIGPGAVDEKDLPALLEKLKSPDPETRAQAADDLRSLEPTALPGNATAEIAAALTPLLADPNTNVQLSAATALLRIAPKDSRPLDLLAKSLQSTDTATRRQAATLASYAGPAVAPLTPTLAVLLKDPDPATKIAALQALSVLGPLAAAAVPQITPLLADPALAIDAADALGRIGPAARPIPPALTQMLTSEIPATRWAAVRAISQIGAAEGTTDANPAIDFMVKALPTAQEVDLYNIHIYFALLGPTAQYAAPAIRTSKLKNPVLPAATLWALDPEKSFPWQIQIRMGSGGHPIMSTDPGPGGADLNKYIYEALFIELGPRLKPAAQKFVDAILNGTETTAGAEIPTWGYKLLTCDTDSSLAQLIPHLADDSLTTRERAAVALGYMGKAARPAKPALQSALAKSQTPQEKLLLQWSLRQINPH